MLAAILLTDAVVFTNPVGDAPMASSSKLGLSETIQCFKTGPLRNVLTSCPLRKRPFVKHDRASDFRFRYGLRLLRPALCQFWKIKLPAIPIVHNGPHDCNCHQYRRFRIEAERDDSKHQEDGNDVDCGPTKGIHRAIAAVPGQRLRHGRRPPQTAAATTSTNCSPASAISVPRSACSGGRSSTSTQQAWTTTRARRPRRVSLP